MTNQVQVFILKTDIYPFPVPFMAVPCGYNGSEPVVLPVVEDSVELYHLENDTSIDETLVISLRRNFSARDIRGFISLYVKKRKSFLLFICDSVQRSALVVNTINGIYGQENISRYIWSNPSEGKQHTET